MPHVKVPVVMRTFILTGEEKGEGSEWRIKCGKRARQYSRVLFL